MGPGVEGARTGGGRSRRRWCGEVSARMGIHQRFGRSGSSPTPGCLIGVVERHALPSRRRSLEGVFRDRSRGCREPGSRTSHGEAARTRPSADARATGTRNPPRLPLGWRAVGRAGPGGPSHANPGRDQALLLVFEDAHWIDSESQGVLDALVESLPTACILLLVVYRPEYRHRWADKGYYSQIRVDPLSADDAERLLEGLIGKREAVVALKPLLLERTEGNPFFIEESI